MTCKQSPVGFLHEYGHILTIEDPIEFVHESGTISRTELEVRGTKLPPAIFLHIDPYCI